VSRLFLTGFIAVAAGLLTSCTVTRQPVEEALVYAPAPVSTLLSRQDLPFKTAHVQRGASLLTVLAYQAPGARPSPIAEIATTRIAPADPMPRISVRLLDSDSKRANGPDVDIVGVELLYFLTVQLEPQARFCLARATQPCDFTNGGLSHPEVLRQLALARQEAIARAGRARTAAEWQTVSMAPGAVEGDHVSVRVTSERRPLQGASIYFNRAPHSGCGAKTGDDGVAACDLVDQHGDEDEDRQHAAARVVATFPGDVRAGHILVPTTFSLPLSR
jgi:hypothetical protein